MGLHSPPLELLSSVPYKLCFLSKTAVEERVQQLKAEKLLLRATQALSGPLHCDLEAVCRAWGGQQHDAEHREYARGPGTGAGWRAWRLAGHMHTYPTDSARAFVDSSDTKTWQANRWSAGCLVMNPKYLGEGSLWVGWAQALQVHSQSHAPLRWLQTPSPHLELCPTPLTCCSLDGIHRKRRFLTGKSGYIYSPTGRRRGWSSACGGHGGTVVGKPGPGGSPWPPGSHRP